MVVRLFTSLVELRRSGAVLVLLTLLGETNKEVQVEAGMGRGHQ